MKTKYAMSTGRLRLSLMTPLALNVDIRIVGFPVMSARATLTPRPERTES